MTFILKHDLDMVTMYQRTKNEVSLLTHSKLERTHTHTHKQNTRILPQNKKMGSLREFQINSDYYVSICCLQRLKKYKEAREDQMFPDEVDTPSDVPAKIRFQR